MEAIISRLNDTKMSNFDNFTPTSTKYDFKSQAVISKKARGKCVNCDSNIFFDDELYEFS